MTGDDHRRANGGHATFSQIAPGEGQQKRPISREGSQSSKFLPLQGSDRTKPCQGFLLFLSLFEDILLCPSRKNTTPTCPCPQHRVVCILLVLLAEAIRTVHNGKQCGRSTLISSSPALRAICTSSHNWSVFVEVLAIQISLAPCPPFLIFL